jgi:hypothetical protein
MWMPMALLRIVGDPRWNRMFLSKANVVISQPAVYVPMAQNAT